jgi:hypothetical protein
MGTMKGVFIDADGTETVQEWEIPADLQAKLDADRAWYKEMRAAGTPFWCIHKDRSVSDPNAYWQDDSPSLAPFHKHGVRCRECGGYIQLG